VGWKMGVGEFVVWFVDISISGGQDVSESGIAGSIIEAVRRK
jgi:hypothetical protein